MYFDIQPKIYEGGGILVPVQSVGATHRLNTWYIDW